VVSSPAAAPAPLRGVLVLFHCGSNTGFAIGRLESVFLQMARRLAGDDQRIAFSYPSLRGGRSESLTGTRVLDLELDPTTRDAAALREITALVRSRNIELVFGFDQPPHSALYAALRAGGVRTVISYWGAPMGSIVSGARLLAKRMIAAAAYNGPDRYVFESEAMRRTATHGRGIAARKTSVVHLGVDTAQFAPEPESRYVHETFGLDPRKRVVVYSGHMEPRKGVHVIVQAAMQIANDSGRSDIHFVLLGNAPGEQQRFEDMYAGTAAQQYITFGGYRKDIARIFSSSYLGVIASTGWDSFTRSSVEMAASGLPIIVSRLQGLAETVQNGVTGFLFEPGNSRELAVAIAKLCDDPSLRDSLALAARARALRDFGEARQIDALVDIALSTHAARTS
jgi:glycosyltransferase involved in cell wall biosynthesis